MTGDIRKQLGEALDQAEKLARAAHLGDCWYTAEGLAEGQLKGGAGLNDVDALHIARWDPSTVLRLIERDRALIERHHPESGYDRPPCVGCHANFVEDWYGTVEECPELLAAAAFWLSSSEVTDGR